MTNRITKVLLRVGVILTLLILLRYRAFIAPMINDLQEKLQGSYEKTKSMVLPFLNSSFEGDKTVGGSLNLPLQEDLNVQTKGAYMEHPVNDNFELEQMRRRNVLHAACQQMDLEKNVDEIIKNKPWGFHFFLVDDIRKTILCFLPKVANTNWKKVWMVLTGLSKAHEHPKGLDSIGFNNAHGHLGPMQLKRNNKKLTDAELKEKLMTYTKAICVRNPWERLLSAYKASIEPRNLCNLPIKITGSLHRSKNCSSLEWGDFIDLASTTKWSSYGDKILQVQKHWAPYYELCHPCAIKSDFILKFDNLVQEANIFLKRINATENLHFPSFPDRRPNNSSDVLTSYMENITVHQIDRFYETYKPDFQLFQYPKWKK